MNEVTADIVKQGLAAARVGDTDEARRLLTQATQQYPDNIEAWLGLAGVVNSLDYKKKCFNQILEIDPENIEARTGLALIDEKLSTKEIDPEPAIDPVFAPPQPDAAPTVCYRHPDTKPACSATNVVITFAPNVRFVHRWAFAARTVSVNKKTNTIPAATWII